MLVILGFAEILVTGKQLHHLAEIIEVLHQAMADVPLAPIAILNAAADGLGARRLQFVAGHEEFIPGLGRILRVKSGLFEQHFIVAPEHRQRIPAEPVDVAAEVAENGRVRGLDDVVLDEAVQRLHVAEPDALHVIDAVPEILDIGRVSRRRRGLELRNHHRGILQHGFDAHVLVGGN